ncbi:hypothetical protein PVA54_004365 [Escherichia coli]|nr:hypothetical protein [Escherichia coli]ELC3559094.1 hypothetical protein [Escherichia coli]MDZ8493485.1 hypothetical protein [Escherichia coli]
MASITTERCNSCPFQNKGNPRKTEFSSRINSVVAGRWSLVAGRWSLVAGRWSLVAGRWSLVWQHKNSLNKNQAFSTG